VRVTSCDPIYEFAATDIRQRIDDTSRAVLEQTRTNAHEFAWTSIRSVDELYRVRMRAMDTFLADYPAGRAAGRYVAAALPTLPFDDASFDLALSSHFLFLYTAQLGDAFHRRALREMCRVAREVRIFPLLALGGQPSPLVDLVAHEFNLGGLFVSIEKVDYEFQRGGNQMMRITRGASAARTA
jgi:SAM-dependent methyltransferase